jgi:hypothetical protein
MQRADADARQVCKLFDGMDHITCLWQHYKP